MEDARCQHGAERLLGVAIDGVGVDLVGVDVNGPLLAEDVGEGLFELGLFALPVVTDCPPCRC